MSTHSERAQSLNKKPNELAQEDGPDVDEVDASSLNIDVLNKNLHFDKGLKEKAAINDSQDAYKEYLY